MSTALQPHPTSRSSSGTALEELLRARTPDLPSGANLDDSPLMSALDRFSVFGRYLSYGERGRDGSADDVAEFDWAGVRDTAQRALEKSNDLRALAHWAVATLWTDGLSGFADALSFAATWLETAWSHTYPRVDEDAMVRRGALLCFTDQMAVLNRLRRVPLVRGRLGMHVSVRDVDIATGWSQPADGERQVGQEEIAAAFADANQEDLTRLAGDVARGLDAVKRIASAMTQQAGSEWVPDLGPLASALLRIQQVVTPRLVESGPRARVDAETECGGASRSVVASPGPGGAVTTREEAVRALEAVSAFFRRSEPSSPVPLVVDRAKRLVTMEFLEILAEIAPDAVAQARRVGGLAPSE